MHETRRTLFRLVAWAVLFDSRVATATKYTTSGDRYVAAAAIQSLDGEWNASLPSRSLALRASVPGDLISDLERAGLVPDPLVDVNWRDNASVALWNASGWEYSRTFVVGAAHAGSSAFLVFDSVKMGATVSVNSEAIATLQSQFLRYVLPVKLRTGLNTITVVFQSEMNTGRYMACSGGWDWAPYSNTKTATGVMGDGSNDTTTEPTFTKGIVKSAYLAFTAPASAMIEYSAPQITFTGDDYPTEPLSSGSFHVSCRVHLRYAAAAGVKGMLHVAGAWGASKSAEVSIAPGGKATTAVVVVNLTASDVELWWPNGYGTQRQYTLTTTFSSSMSASAMASGLEAAPVAITQPIGFRYAVLVTGNDTDAAFRRQARTGDGSGGHSMMVRVNGAPVLSVGANLVPLEELEGRNTVEAQLNLATSLAAAHFTAIRIWGGGVFMPDRFYEKLSELGVMVFHDLMYAGGGHMPQVVDGGADGGAELDARNTAELQQIARRLAHQAALIYWNGCNECGGGKGAITDFAIPAIAAEDATRPVWPASPAHNGWRSGVNTLTGFPNGQPLRIGGAPVNETHGPYTFGSTSAFKPAENGHQPEADFVPALLPVPGGAKCVAAWFAAGCSCTCAEVGPSYPGTFASEFGTVGMSSFESMAATLSAQNWGVHANTTVWTQRNYPTDSLVTSYFGQPPGGGAGEHVLKQQMYLSMLAQALHHKQDIEQRRGGNTWALLAWMLNEIWPTGGWGSLEYGSAGQKQSCEDAAGGAVPCGQVTGGRWKPLHHFLASSAFSPTTAALCANGSVYVRNDVPKPFAGRLIVATVELAKQAAGRTLLNKTIALPAGAGQLLWVPAEAALAACSDGSCALLVKVLDANGETVSENLQTAVVPHKLQLPQHATVSFTIHDEPAAAKGVDITVKASSAAMWVALTSGADGYFSPNWFSLGHGEERAVRFIPFAGIVSPATRALLHKTTRVEHLGEYIA